MKIPQKIGRWIIRLVVGIILFFSLTGNDGIIDLYRTHRYQNDLVEEINNLQKIFLSYNIVTLLPTSINEKRFS